MSAVPTDVRYDQAAIEADPDVPMIHILRDFAGTPAQLFAAHTDPDLVSRWIGPADSTTEVLAWEPTDNGRWRYSITDRNGVPQLFRGSWPSPSPSRCRPSPST